MVESSVTLITGGTSGIGAAIARRLLADGGRVAVTGRDRERLDRFVDDCREPDRLMGLIGDAADNAAVVAAVEACVKKFGQLDNIVANAGYATHDGLGDGDPETWRDMVLTNVLGPALLVRAALPHVKQARGRMVFIGSVAGLVYTPGNIYGATKWAVTGLAENARRMVAEDGVGVTLIAPGRVETGFWAPVGGAPKMNNLSAEQIADAAFYALNQPEGVDVNTITIRPTGQAV